MSMKDALTPDPPRDDTDADRADGSGGDEGMKGALAMPAPEAEQEASEQPKM